MAGWTLNAWSPVWLAFWILEYLPHGYIHSFIHSFIHTGYFYSASSSPLLLRGAPDTARILCRSFTPKRHRQLRVKDLPKVPTRRLERESNPRPFWGKALNLPMGLHAPQVWIAGEYLPSGKKGECYNYLPDDYMGGWLAKYVTHGYMSASLVEYLTHGNMGEWQKTCVFRRFPMTGIVAGWSWSRWFVALCLAGRSNPNHVTAEMTT